MSIEKLRPTFTFTEDRLRELQAVAPEAFADGRIHWDTLREALGEHLEDESQEHFGLTWPGKREARRLAALLPEGTLVPAPGEGVNEETTRNIFIEGENLEVLKLLQKSYAGRVKMIYIDPPYNTGNDFVYPDDYSEPLEAYLERTGQLDDEGRKLTTNTRASGRFHSNWLNMMYPRLLLARHLLRSDGSIFVSIDNNEIGNLRLLLDEVFGAENFVDCVIWQKKVSPSNDAKWFSSDHDYLMVYAVNKEIWRPNRLSMNERQRNYYQNPDNDPRGPWNSATYTCNKTREERPNLYFPITNPNTGEQIWPSETAVWKYSEDVHRQNTVDKLIYWGRDGRGKPRLKVFLGEDNRVVPRSIWLYDDVGHTQEATQEFLRLVPEGGFDTPKPPRLIKRILDIATNVHSTDIVLDFFAGSGTTAQAALEWNRTNSSKLRFIMVQLPEPTPPDSRASNANFNTIADIAKERIRRAISAMPADDAGQESSAPDEDLGFKVLELERSSFRTWSTFESTDLRQLEDLFSYNSSPLVSGWTPEGLLTEIILLEGFPLDCRQTHLEAVTNNTIHRVHHPDLGHELYICLDAAIAPETLALLKAGDLVRGDNIFICLDSALSDEAKVVLADRLRLKVI